MKVPLPHLFGDNEKLLIISNEVEKINKERTRQSISTCTLTCDY